MGSNTKAIDVKTNKSREDLLQPNYFSAPPVFYQDKNNNFGLYSSSNDSNPSIEYLSTSMTNSPYIGNNWNKFSIKKHLCLSNYLYLQNAISNSHQIL